MLQSISWNEFFWTISIVFGAYYSIVVLLLFGTELKSFLARRLVKQSKGTESETTRQSALLDQLVGGIRHSTIDNSQQQKAINAEEVLVLSNEEPEETVNPVQFQTGEEALINSASKLHNELTDLIFSSPPESIDEARIIIGSILGNHSELIGTIHQPEAIDFVHSSLNQQTKIQIARTEIMNWWNESATRF